MYFAAFFSPTRSLNYYKSIIKLQFGWIP